jgi:uncharacterized Zn-finger protein
MTGKEYLEAQVIPLQNDSYSLLKYPEEEFFRCPYCGNKDGVDLYYDKDIFIYVDPKGYLRFGTPDGVGKTEIQFCPMCGKSLK